MSKISDTIIEEQDTGVNVYGKRTPIVDDKRFNVLEVEDKGPFKVAILEEKGNQYSVTLFFDNSQYNTIKKGDKVDGWIRIKQSFSNLVDYYKPERNWTNNEKFI